MLKVYIILVLHECFMRHQFPQACNVHTVMKYFKLCAILQAAVGLTRSPSVPELSSPGKTFDSARCHLKMSCSVFTPASDICIDHTFLAHSFTYSENTVVSRIYRQVKSLPSASPDVPVNNCFFFIPGQLHFLFV